jgi:hypothetical protein
MQNTQFADEIGFASLLFSVEEAVGADLALPVKLFLKLSEGYSYRALECLIKTVSALIAAPLNQPTLPANPTPQWKVQLI